MPLPTSPNAPAIRFVDVSRHFGREGEVRAVDGVSLEIADGEFFALLGPSGSGKTTCLRLVAGFERPDAGRVELHGVDVTDLPPYERDVNTVFQDYALFPHLSVAENVAYGLTVRRLPKAEIDRRVGEALALVRLPGIAARRPQQLSGGQRQRVALARALVNRPRVLLLDEPLGALDARLRQEMQGELTAIQREVAITFLFVTHDQEEAFTMSDRLAVFEGGRIAQVGTPAEIYERPANRFVAEFVGSTNLFEGAAAAALGEPGATILVRPERIALRTAEAAASEGGATLSGRLVRTVYAGAMLRHVVALELGGEALVVEPSGVRAARLEPGTAVRLGIARDQIHRLEPGR